MMTTESQNNQTSKLLANKAMTARITAKTIINKPLFLVFIYFASSGLTGNMIALAISFHFSQSPPTPLGAGTSGQRTAVEDRKVGDSHHPPRAMAMATIANPTNSRVEPAIQGLLFVAPAHR